MEKVVRRLAVCCLLLFAFVGSAAAQNDPLYVIKRRIDAVSTDDHYLAHVVATGSSGQDTIVLQDVTTFDPATCLWYSGNTHDHSGTNHNYYFIDGENHYRFLSAPLTPNAQLSLSDSLISTTLLRNSEHIYYFWDWDWNNEPIDGGGVARGVRRTGYDQTSCGQAGYSYGSGQCWEVYWVEYVDGTGWKLTSSSQYTLNNGNVPNASRFHKVTVTDHPLEILNVSGGLGTLASREIEHGSTLSVAAPITVPYTYDSIQRHTSYSFVDVYGNASNNFAHNDHAYYYYNGDNGDHSQSPDTTSISEDGILSYQWSLSGAGAQYLTMSGEYTNTVTLSYTGSYPSYHQTATLTLKVTYKHGNIPGSTQEISTSVLVKTVCHNPVQAAEPVILYDYATVSWHETSDSYILTWTKSDDTDWSNSTSTTVVGSTSYTISGLEPNTAYKYKVQVACDSEDPTVYNFTTKREPGLLVFGSVFGGGRIAQVGGKADVVIINCDSIHAVYGGNDIADTIKSPEGARITLGVNANDEYSTLYNGSKASDKVRIGDVYGGGNGYYAYNGTSFTAADSYYTSEEVAPGASVFDMTTSNQLGDTAWTNKDSDPRILPFPVLTKTAITVTNDKVKVDSLFGGAKNAFVDHKKQNSDGSYILNSQGEYTYYSIGDTIAINGGTILAVFGGNNIGGTQGYGKHRIHVAKTKIDPQLRDSIINTAIRGYGREFGIRYLFGGGNKVAGSTTDVTIVGGQLDTIFGGGNEADVYGAYLSVDCPIAEGSGATFGSVYSEAIKSYSSNVIIAKDDYEWDGFSGVYNVRTLFGGNNKAAMEKVPHVTLTSGSMGTVYGGGNQGDMLASDSLRSSGGVLVIDGNHVKFGTHVEMNSPNIVIDYLYGGCQMSNVDYSTWVEIKQGHVGNVYGGCNVSGDVGSTRINSELVAPAGLDDENFPPEQAREYYLEYQKVQGATYVEATGGTVYKNLFGGSNGYYHCNDGIKYVKCVTIGQEENCDIHFGDLEFNYIGLPIPTHNETHAIIDGVTIKGDAYAGGNLAPVGFDRILAGNNAFPRYVGLASLNMKDGTIGVENSIIGGNVYGGGNMAAVYGSNEVKVSGGTIYNALYGGNDHLGQVANPTSRALPDEYNYASDTKTPLTDVKTYVSVTGKPHVNTVYGGGNGDYDYTEENAYCDPTDLPIQSHTFVDINIDGFPNATEGGYINTVYGGGNGVTVNGSTRVLLNVKGETPTSQPVAYDHVGTIFGGNNKGSLNILADIILLKGQVNTVYGGCNKGAMLASETVYDRDSVRYDNIGSVVRLRHEYVATVDDTLVPTAVVSGTVYAGCRMNSVVHNSLVLVEGGNHPNATIYGGSDISGAVGDTSRIIITAVTPDEGPVVGDVYGGGNGHYYYEGNKVYSDALHQHLVDTIKSGTLAPPYCDSTLVQMYGGTAANLYGGGYAGPCGLTIVQVEGGNVTQSVYGAGKEAGTTIEYTIDNTNDALNGVQFHQNGSTSVTMHGGNAKEGIYGGCHNSGTVVGDIAVNIYAAVGSVNDTLDDGIFGGGYGGATATTGNVTVTIKKDLSDDPAPVIYGDVYGGSAYGQVNDPDASTPNLTNVIFEDGTLHGIIYGGGKGSSLPGEADSTYVNGNVQVDFSGDTIFGGIYGGCNAKGSVKGNVIINVTDGIISSDTLYASNHSIDTIKNGYVFGGGYGERTTTAGNVEVNINGDGVKIYGDVYGGSGYGSVNTYVEDDDDDVVKITEVNIEAGHINKTTLHNVNYGGDVYGGGLGAEDIEAKVFGKVYVNVGSGGLNADGCPVAISGAATIDGSVYGCNNVNGTPLDSVFVNIYRTGHGVGPANNEYPDPDVVAQLFDDGESGFDDDTLVSIKDLEINYKPISQGGQGQAFALRAVYGGGNRAAYLPPLNDDDTPKCTTVHVWGCQENTIEDIYGGGNAANVGDTTNAGVRIPADTRVIIDGGRIHRMFGGGNGFSATGNHNNPSLANYNPGANIFGTASSFVYAGLIDEVYGGANQFGSIDIINLNVLSTDCCDDAAFGKVFGCANEAPINHSIVTTIGCGVGEIGDLYGGSNLASIGVNNPNKPKANVTLNIFGGDYENVYAGSRGRIEGEDGPAIAASIYGDVTLNLYGGTIINAFGGSDQLGDIKGIITVNVLDYEDCPLDVTNVYGGSKLANYEPWKVNGATVQSPIVNVMHIHNVDVVNEQQVMKGIRGNVYGGGYQATVKANPVVNIGYEADTVVYGTTTMANLIPSGPHGYPPTSTLHNFPHAYISGSVFGGGEEAAIFGQSTVNIRQAESETRMDKVFGGGDMANVDTTLVNIYNGTVVTGVYGGCNEKGNISHDVSINIYGGTLGVAGAPMSEGIFGGGYGGYDNESRPGTTTDGNVTITIDTLPDHNAPVIYADIYGGSAFGEVGATGKLTKVDLKNGTVHGKIFGGGKGQLSDETTSTPAYSASVMGNAELAIAGTVLDSIFGGCNVNGVVKGNARVCITSNGKLGAAQVGTQGEPGYQAEIRANAYGGGLGAATKVKGNVVVILDTITGHSTVPEVYGDVYGGSAKGLVNCTETGNPIVQNGYAKTNTTLKAGNIHGSLYGGGHGIGNADAHVYGPVTVSIEGGEVNNVFGCNNTAGAPQDTVIVYVMGGVMDSVFGGGNVAAYAAPFIPNSNTTRTNYPLVHVSGGDVRFKVAGGGNAAHVSGNPHVYVTDRVVGETTVIPTIGTSTNTTIDKGVYGGCNTEGTVYGNTLVELVGGIVGMEGSSNNRDRNANIHGGGYGQPTEVLGNVTVNFGKVVYNGTEEEHTVRPTLYGDLYGGSALGKVNTPNGNDGTTVNLMNGSIRKYHKTINNADSLVFSQAFGGGLGVKGSVPAVVYGQVHVNVGMATNPDLLTTYTGKADLIGCDVFGCNNQNGSPQKEVYVDVYKTNHIRTDSVDYVAADRTYAINQVFGGGNESDYTIDNKKVQVYIHKCENTIRRIFGGGNAAAVYGIDLWIDGGRHYWVFGGGNGELGPAYAANIGLGGITIHLGGGNIQVLVNGSNEHGDVQEGGAGITLTTYEGCENSYIVDHFMGANQTTIWGDVNEVISCPTDMRFVNLYCGSNLAQIYGNINLTIEGGVFDNVFGGSKGSLNNQSNPPGFQTYPSCIHDNPNTEATEGHVKVLITGGHIGNLYGACDENGNVDGRINLTIYDANYTCGFFVGNIYGGGNHTDYYPLELNDGSGCEYSPEIKILNGTIGGPSDVLPVKDHQSGVITTYAGNVYGGGNEGNVGGLYQGRVRYANPKVIVGDGLSNTSVTIEGDVFGGGNLGDVTGNPLVVVVPETHTLTVAQPTTEVGCIFVTNCINDTIINRSYTDTIIGEDIDANIKAVASVYGHAFAGWNVNNGHVASATSASTVFTMGTRDAILSATFVDVDRHTFTVQSQNGSVTVTDGFGQPLTSDQIGEGAVLNIVATPATGYRFAGWTCTTGSGASIDKPNSMRTTFTMGTSACTLTANFVSETGQSGQTNSGH